MKKKTRNLVIAGTAAVILVCTGGYMFMQDYLGNKIKIHQVIASADSAAAGGPTRPIPCQEPGMQPSPVNN